LDNLNIDAIVSTREVFHVEILPLKFELKNKPDILFTLETSHLDKSQLKYFVWPNV
jgi:hypothetical protein